LQRHKINRIVVVADLTEENRVAVAQQAAQAGLALTEWRSGERPFAAANP
jgi:hypothetical protein